MQNTKQEQDTRSYEGVSLSETAFPLGSGMSYAFQILVESCQAFISVGFCSSDFDHEQGSPTESKHAWVYNSYVGSMFHDDPNAVGVECGPTFKEGDRVGCVLHDTGGDDGVCIYYFHNDQQCKAAWSHVPATSEDQALRAIVEMPFGSRVKLCHADHLLEFLDPEKSKLSPGDCPYSEKGDDY